MFFYKLRNFRIASCTIYRKFASHDVYRGTHALRRLFHLNWNSLHQNTAYSSYQDTSITKKIMSTSFNKFSYVRSFETDDKVAPHQWIVISLGLEGIDKTQLFLNSMQSREILYNIMAESTKMTFNEFPAAIRMAYLHFDKVHFVVDRDADLYQRRANKLLTYLCSSMASYFVTKQILFVAGTTIVSLLSHKF